MSTQCPCGLTQEKLDAKGWVDDEQCCKTKYKDANGNVQVCGELYSSHPSASSQQSLSSSQQAAVTAAAAAIAAAQQSTSSADGPADTEPLSGKFVSFNINTERQKYRPVTAWISGDRMSINVNVPFGEFLDDVGDSLGLSHPRVYVLLGQNIVWRDRVRLDDDNFELYKNKEGTFKDKVCSLYACSESSPTESPSNKGRVDNAEESSRSSGTSRSGQTDFRDAVLRRDRSKCVFCDAISNLEAAHILPNSEKHLLEDRENCEHYGIFSIMDSVNGLTLCSQCHLCFDSSHVCIDPETDKLIVSDALMANEEGKWKELMGKIVPLDNRFRPNANLLSYRVTALEQATEKRHKRRDEYLFMCKCGKVYKSVQGYQNHKEKCSGVAKTAASYNTPVKDDVA